MRRKRAALPYRREARRLAEVERKACRKLHRVHCIPPDERGKYTARDHYADKLGRRGGARNGRAP